MEIEPGIDGLVHVSDMSWTRRVEHPSEVVHKGQELDVMVLDVDAENKRISLGIKQLQDDPWPSISERFAPGVESDGTVLRVQDKGVVVDLTDDIEGFVPASHSGVEDADRLEEYYGTGDTVSLRVVESDAANRRIVLEVTETPPRKSPEEIEAARIAAAEAAAAAAAAASAAEADDDEPIVRKPKAAEPAEAESEASAPVPAAEAAPSADAADDADSGEAADDADSGEEAEVPEAEAGEAPEAEAEAAEPEADASAEEGSEEDGDETDKE